MSYPDACNDQELTCQRVPYFSTTNDTPLGVVLGVERGDPEAADNVAMLALSGNSVANFFGPERPSGLTASNGEFDDSIVISWHDYPLATSYTLAKMAALIEIDGHPSCKIGNFSVVEWINISAASDRVLKQV